MGLRVEFLGTGGALPIPRPLCACLEHEATFEETVEVARKLDAGRVLVTHVEEADGLGHDDLEQVAARLRADGLELAFAYDTLVVEV